MRSIKYLHYIAGAIALSVSCLAFSAPPLGKDVSIDRIVVFGASLSDPGNAFVLLSDPAAFEFSDECIGQMGVSANVPPYDALDEFLVPDGSYAKGGHHETNGATWIEQFARGKGLSGNVRPALRNTGTKASNYAVGGARTADFPCRFNLADQLIAYQGDFSATSANTLVVIEMGGNDVRDALVAGSAEAAESIISDALTHIGNAIQTLYGQGARKFLLVNVPAIGNTPAVQIIDDKFGGGAGNIIDAANYLAGSFNYYLAELEGAFNSNEDLPWFFNVNTPEINVRTLNLYGLLNEIIDKPSAFGIINTENACVTPNVPPYKCKKPDTYLFWDGIHPTKVVHDIMAQRAAEVLMR